MLKSLGTFGNLNLIVEEDDYEYDELGQFELIVYYLDPGKHLHYRVSDQDRVVFFFQFVSGPIFSLANSCGVCLIMKKSIKLAYIVFFFLFLFLAHIQNQGKLII